MDELVRWLGEQLDADAATAEAAPPGPWSMDGSGSIVAADDTRVVCSVGGTIDGRVSRWPEGPVVEHVLAHDPARVLREINAKRELLSRYKAMAADVLVMTGVESILSEYRRVVLPNLAAGYSDRPGYREEWRP